MSRADARPTGWFRDWFGGEYLALYPHRDEAEARRAVALLRRATGLGPGARVLDVGCGAGRHLAELGRVGCRATGLDLSERMLAAARERAPEARLARGDMRALPFAAAAFDVATSYFTSFGYFADERDDRRVLAEIRRVVEPGGFFLLDFMNADRVVANLRTLDRRTVSGREVVQERRVVEGGRVVEKAITIGARAGEPERRFVERVRLYRPEELDAMMERAGLEPDRRYGAYDPAPFAPASPRYIVVARVAGTQGAAAEVPGRTEGSSSTRSQAPNARVRSGLRGAT